MKGFVKRKDIDDVIKILKHRVKPLTIEDINFNESLNRVLAEDIKSNRNVPEFRKSAMDGYALRAKDTFGSSNNNPLSLNIVGEILIGESPDIIIKKSQAVKIMTGAAIPEGADAVIMVEYTEEEKGIVKIFQSIPPGKNVHRIGEDVKKGEIIIKKNTIIKPQHIGILCILQKIKIKVYKRPSVAIIATGNELIPPKEKKEKYKIIDSNSYIIESMVISNNSIPIRKGIFPDIKENIKKAIMKSYEDIIIIIGGSSVGNQDFTPIIIKEVGKLIVHGVTIRPGSPTGIGFIKDKPVFLLPGNPVAAIIAYDCFVKPTLRFMQNLNLEDKNLNKVTSKLKRKINSGIGRTDFVRVKIEKDGVSPIRVSGAGVLTTMTKSDGIIIVPKNKEGIEKGESVEVNLL